MGSRYDVLFKLLLIGDSSVGKTSILVRFTEDNFNPTFTSTIGIDFKLRTVDIDGQKVKLQLWDTAGQERYRTTCTSYFRGAMGIILVYDMTNERSFSSITTWMNSIEENASDDVCKMIIGNKCDLESSRIISTERGELLAERHGARFMETSAKSGFNVEMAIMTIARDIKHKIDRKNAEVANTDDAASPLDDTIQVSEHEQKRSNGCCR